MSNPYYSNTGYPQLRAPGKSEDMRAELKRIESGMDRLPNPIMPNQPVFGNASGTGMTMKDKVSAKALLDLDLVDNTADTDKPISTAVTAALATKADAAETTAALATKADAAETTAALATKADAAETTAALATKADAEQLKQHQNKNLLINGSFIYWDYGTNQSSSGYGSDNNWKNLHVGSEKIHTFKSYAQETSYQYNISTTMITSVTGISNYVMKQQLIEDVRETAGKILSVSFVARSLNSTKNISIEFFQNFGTGGSPSSPVYAIGVNKIELSSRFNLYKIEGIEIPGIFNKIVGTDSNGFLGFNIWFDAGESFNDRTLSLGQQSKTIDIAWVKVEIGDKCTDFYADPIEERLRCDRYCQLINIDIRSFSTSYINAIWNTINLRNKMRINPTAVKVINGTLLNATTNHQFSDSHFNHRLIPTAQSVDIGEYGAVYRLGAEL